MFAEICGLPKVDSGKCLAYFKLWTYDSKKNKCVIFIYGGCQGNENSFKSKEECITKSVE